MSLTKIYRLQHSAGLLARWETNVAISHRQHCRISICSCPISCILIALVGALPSPWCLPVASLEENMSMSTQQRCRLSFEMWNLQSTWWVGSFLNFRSKILVPETKNRDFCVTKIWTDCCHLEEVCNFKCFLFTYYIQIYIKSLKYFLFVFTYICKKMQCIAHI